MRKTKIICTLGPATDREGVLENMIKAGMDVARVNFSHGSHESTPAGHRKAVRALRQEMLNLPLATMLDTQRPRDPHQVLKYGPVGLETGQTFVLTARDVAGDKHVGERHTTRGCRGM